MLDLAPQRKDSLTARLTLKAARLLSMSLLLIAALGVASGCSAKSSALTFKSAHSDVEYAQDFTCAFYEHTDNGEYHAVLIEDGIHPGGNKPRGPIVASAAAPLSQTVHVRVLWRPIRGTKPDTPSATNAVIDWYVRTNDSAQANDLLHYRGAGFVVVSESKGKATFTIRSAHLELTDSAGRLHDPLGDSSLTGRFVAINNPGVVNTTVETLVSAGQKPGAPSPAAHEGPPPRAPAGP
jgi:hypothetical protein